MIELDQTLEELVQLRTAELHRANQALAIEKEQLAVTLRSLGDGVITTDIEQCIVLFNPVAEQLTGWTRDEAVGRNLADVFRIVNSKTREPAANPAQQAIERGTKVGLTAGTALVARDGTEYMLSASVAPLRDNAKQIVGVVLAFRDITFIKRAEQALQEAKEAEAANQAKSQFLAHMSHEIRTPIHGITGLTSLVLNTELTREQREYVDMIKSSADVLLALVNDILDLSKIEAGRLQMEQIPFDLTTLVEQSVETLAFRAHSQGLELITEIAPDVPNAVLGDPVRLRQVLTNLLTNAIKFTAHGQVIVTVENQEPADVAEQSQYATVRFAVQDTGIGIAEDKQALVFEAFRQSDNSTTRQYGGTGLGLTISRQLVELMGGEMSLESRLGEGSTFHFTLRLPRQPNGAENQILPFEPAWRGLPALIVDDNAASRALLDRVLSEWGLQVTQVSNGLVALQALEQARDAGHPFKLVLLDAEMPKLDGITTAAWFRDDPLIKNSIVMLLTSNKAHSGGARCQEMGLDAYVIKPIKRSELFASVAKVLNAQPNVEPNLIPTEPRAEAASGLRILLVEDNAVNQIVGKRLLEQNGHHVQLAGNGIEATSKYRQGEFDVILMDVEMPLMDGLQATRLIRQSEAESGARHVPILAVTAYATTQNREMVLQAGMDGYLSKPFKLESLQQELRPFLAQNDQRAVPMIFDRAAALDAVGGSEDILEQVVEIFLAQDYPRHLENLNAAIREGDGETLRKAAHGLKGAILSFGGTAAAQTAFELQELGASGKLDSAPTTLAELERQIESFAASFEAFREHARSAGSGSWLDETEVMVE